MQNFAEGKCNHAGMDELQASILERRITIYRN